MKKQLLTITMLIGFVIVANGQKKGTFGILAKYEIKSDGGWDYLTIDQKTNNIFVSHGNQVNVLSKNGDSIGVIKNTLGVHGIAIVNAVGKGYTSNGKLGTCTVFDLKNFVVLGQIKVGENPDAIFYDDYSKKVIVFNGKSKDASIIDPQNDKVLATVPLGGKPEAGVSDDKGNIFVNIEDTGEIVSFESRTFKVTARYKLKNGEEPSGLAIDRATSRLFTVCGNKLMLVLDSKTGAQVASLPIGEGCDGVVFDKQAKLIYSSNGEGTVTVVKEKSANKFKVVETVKSEMGARTIALNESTGRIFLPTASFEKSTIAGQRPKRISGTFRVLEIGK
ncbi:YncE family protein [Pedobacter changchengzhani]|uniref:YncE family protein n=1 Tax=Pedobacter changchengzhani TaxID=2529274 RepID=A0A4V3A040_9SPHI|nr:YncE family protein [Pedobacter changchengzhani]TDG36163.1 YncE family protein [Pedobacter changchengzhani]